MGSADAGCRNVKSNMVHDTVPCHAMPCCAVLCCAVLQALGLMEVRTVLATLLGRFWFELAPSMGKPAQVRKNQTISLTLKMSEGLKLVATPHDPEPAAKGRGHTAAAPAAPLN